ARRRCGPTFPVFFLAPKSQPVADGDKPGGDRISPCRSEFREGTPANGRPPPPPLSFTPRGDRLSGQGDCAPRPGLAGGHLSNGARGGRLEGVTHAADGFRGSVPPALLQSA